MLDNGIKESEAKTVDINWNSKVWDRIFPVRMTSGWIVSGQCGNLPADPAKLLPDKI